MTTLARVIPRLLRRLPLGGFRVDDGGDQAGLDVVDMARDLYVRRDRRGTAPAGGNPPAAWACGPPPGHAAPALSTPTNGLRHTCLAGDCRSCVGFRPACSG